MAELLVTMMMVIREFGEFIKLKAGDLPDVDCYDVNL
jgi:hypothetical protein